MITIKKGNAPASLIQAKKRGAKVYPDDLGAKEIEDLRKKLLEDQGYVCCYCQNRISYNEGLTRTKIEHFECRSADSDYVNHLNYSNLFIACLGNEKIKNKEKTCDTKKGEKRITSFNLLNSKIETKIRYAKNGVIVSDNKKINNEINNILNLNEENLRIARQQVLYGLQNIKKRLNKKGKYDIGIKKLLEDWESKDSDGKFKSFWAVGLYYLQK